MSFVHAAQLSQDCPLRKLALRGDLLPYCQFSFTDGNVHLKRVSLRVIRRLFPLDTQCKQKQGLKQSFQKQELTLKHT